MTFVQLEYIVALDHFRHFAEAAAHCHVTQPTLSMQIQKLESELGVPLFDRSKHPVVPTETGAEFIRQARKVLDEKAQMEALIEEKKGIVAGELRIGIIPTLAPYLLPLFIQAFTGRHPQIRLVVSELTTELLITRLKEGRLDAGILVTPLRDNALTEHPLFYEEFVAYVSEKNAVFKKSFLLPGDIDPGKLWLLEEGHCFRSQILNLCALRRASRAGSQFEYEAGSFETLRRLVDINDGITILPELAALELTKAQKRSVRSFRAPAPVREVSLVVHRDFVKKRLVDALKEGIVAALPEKIRQNRKANVVAL